MTGGWRRWTSRPGWSKRTLYIFILETIGTQELILVGLVALIVFGPRKLPQMARKFGKMMTEFRKVSNDFRATWEREVAFEDRKPDRAEREPANITGALPENTIGQAESAEVPLDREDLLPKVEEVSAEAFEGITSGETGSHAADKDEEEDESSVLDKQNWL